MTALTECETRLRKAVDELEECPESEIFFAQRGTIAEHIGDAGKVFARASSWYDIHLDPVLRRNFIRFDRMAFHWRIERPKIKLTGEFRIHHLLASLVMDAPPIDWGSTESERQLYSELRVIDDYPGGGTGTFAALRIQPDNPMPEVWYHDFRVGAFKLDLDYCEYLDALTVTKGTFGWQYLYTDVQLAGIDFIEVATDMRDMLDVFPRLFPEYDYSDLRARLEARL